MRRNETGESLVMQEFERIAAEKGWITNKREAQDPAPEHIPTHMVREPHRSALEGMTAPAPTAAVPEAVGAEGHIRRIQSILANMDPQMRGILATTKAPDGVDGQWGPKTLRALREAAKASGMPVLKQLVPRLTAAQPGLKTLVDISAALEDIASKRSAPPPAAGREEMPKEPPAPTHLIKEPHMTQPWQYPTIKELAPKASATIAELIVLANDLDDLGEAKYAEAVDEHLRLYKAAVDKLYDITGETGEQLIGEAHPGGGPTMAPAKEEGGKVETVVEQQKRDMKVVETKPTGKQAAFLARQLVALANRLDMEGKTEAALLVDKTLAELREGSPRPFVGTSKTAATGIMEAIQNFIDTIDGVDVQYKNVLAGIRKTLLTAKNDIYNARQAQAKAPSQRLKDGWAVTEARKIIELDSESDSWWPMIEEAMSWSWASVALIGDKPKLGRAFRTLKSAIVQEKSANQDLFHQAEAQLEAAAPQPPAPGGQPGGTPAPQAGRSEQPKGTPAAADKENKAAHDNFIGTVNKLIKALTNPAKMGEIQKLFGGEEKLDKQLEWLMKLRQTKSPTNELERLRLNRSNNKIWNYYMKALQARKLAAAKVAAPPAKPAKPAKAAPAVPEGGQPLVTAPPVAPAPGKGTVVPRRTKGVAKKPRENLRQLQNAMLAAGIPLPSHQADGKWGPETWRAWNNLRDAIIERRGPGWDIGRPPAPAGNGPGDQAIGAALNMAKQLGRLYSARATVNIASGVQVPERSLASAQAFIKALSAQPNSGVSSKNSPRENAAIALKLAQTYALSLERDDSDESWALAREGVAPQARAAVMDRLVSQLSAMGTGIPSYRMPGSGQPGQERGERQPYGGEGGVGDFGTLEGGREGRGGRGGAGGRERMPTAMSLEDRVDRVPDVSGFVNDPMQFVAWARRYWMSRDEKEARTGDGYVVAHKVLDQLRGQIANLQNALLTSPVGNSASLQNILRQRHEAVNDIYTILPKGR